MLVRPVDDIDFDRRALFDIEGLDIIISDSDWLMTVWTTKLNTIAVFITRKCTDKVVLAALNHIDNTTFSTTAIVC